MSEVSCSGESHASTERTVTETRPSKPNQKQHGAVGITVAKLGEAEVTADAGIEDIDCLSVVGREEVGTVELAGRVRVTVAVDSLPFAAGISQAAKVADVEIGIRAEFGTIPPVRLTYCGIFAG